MNRRTILSGMGGAVALLSGCSVPTDLGGSSEETSDDEADTESTPTDTEPAPNNSIDRFLVETAIYNDNRGEYILDDISVDGTVLTDFESGLGGWEEVHLDDSQQWDRRSDGGRDGSAGARYVYGTQTTSGAGDARGVLHFPFERQNTTGPFRFWAKQSQEPQDDIHFGWGSSTQSDDEWVFAFDVNRETDPDVFVKTNLDNGNIDTQYRLETDRWYRFSFEDIDWGAGTGTYAIETEDGERVAEGDFDFNPLSVES